MDFRRDIRVNALEMNCIRLWLLSNEETRIRIGMERASASRMGQSVAMSCARGETE